MSIKKINFPNLAQIRPYQFGERLLIALDSKWLDLLEDEVKFSVSIKNSHLILTAKLNSQKIQSFKKNVSTSSFNHS